MTLAAFIFIGGILHLGILLASGLTPAVLDWRQSLQKLDPLLRQLIWVHGAFIVLVILGFGLLSLGCASELASGATLARAVCGLMAIFWGARLAVQFCVFDAKPYLNNRLLKLGYHGLTLVFAYHTIVYSWGAIAPGAG